MRSHQLLGNEAGELGAAIRASAGATKQRLTMKQFASNITLFKCHERNGIPDTPTLNMVRAGVCYESILRDASWLRRRHEVWTNDDLKIVQGSA